MAGTTDSDDGRFRRLRELFERALSQPLAARDSFVRQHAADEALARQVLDLLATEGDTVELAAHRATADDEAASPADRVQSTATGELLQNLDTARRLDPERFTIEGEAGRGGMGAILRIHDRFLNRRLAMKVLLEHAPPSDDDERRLANQRLGRFLEEAQVTSQLDHPGVVPVHELGLDQHGKVWFTMRLVKGRTASEVFEDAFHERNDWTLTRALEVVLKVCDTMAYAHDKGVLHRDLKPSNVMVGRFGEVYVMDWGLAKVVGQQDRHDLRIQRPEGSAISKVTSTRRRDAESDTASSVVTIDGTALGTPSYMPPEQARSEELDERADVYAIGAMMYELVAGRAPYTAPGVQVSPYRLLQEVVDGPPKRVEDVQKDVPGELVAVIEKAMARDRDGRYATVGELAADVRAFLAHRVVRAYRTGALVEMRLWMRRNKVLASSIAATALVLAIGIVATTLLATDLAAKVDDYDQLALRITYGRLQDKFVELVPGWPEQRQELADWVRGAEGLLARTDLRERVTRLQRLADDDPSHQILIMSLNNLIELLPTLEQQLPEMRRRLAWSTEIEDATLRHPNARVTWEQARAAIRKADGVVASRLYADHDIALADEHVWGLVPIGMDPQSKLWKFYDLRSAQDGRGLLELPIPTPDDRGKATGIEFVLLPGGRLSTPLADRRLLVVHPFRDEPAEDGDERRRQVRLQPFLIADREVTEVQWARLTRDDDWYVLNDVLDDGGRTRRGLGWDAAVAGLRAAAMTLPSELQWEYAFGPDPHPDTGPNRFGILGMADRQPEWCFDEYEEYGRERDGDGRRPDPDERSWMRSVRTGPRAATRDGCPKEQGAIKAIAVRPVRMLGR